MGRILYLDDPKSNSKAFAVVPNITQEENEINKRKIELAAKECGKGTYRDYLDQKDLGIANWDEYLALQLDKYPTKPNIEYIEVTEAERMKMIYKEYFDVRFPNSDELFESLSEGEIKKMLFNA